MILCNVIAFSFEMKKKDYISLIRNKLIFTRKIAKFSNKFLILFLPPIVLGLLKLVEYPRKKCKKGFR
jgi:hypothetical protein